MTRLLVGIILLVHGIAHAGLAAAPIPRDPASRPGSFFGVPARSWIFRRLRLAPALVRAFGFLLAGTATLLFVLASLAAVGVPPLAGSIAPLAVAGASVSLVLLLAFWHPWIILGVLVDLAVLAAFLGIRRLGVELGP